MFFEGTYKTNDVRFLIEDDVSIPLLSRDEKERKMKEGTHYSDLLSREDEAPLAFYRRAMNRHRKRLASDTLRIAQLIGQKKNPVLISLARAGVPLGCLLRRILHVPHYAVSIIRDRGLDMAAMEYISRRHPDASFIFVDGWTGKGTIASELRKDVPNACLAVLSDPAEVADIAASHDDWLIPFGLLNSVICGGMSRTVWSQGFHKCRHMTQDCPDQSVAFLDEVMSCLAAQKQEAEHRKPAGHASETIRRIQAEFAVTDRNRIKPGLAEAGRGLMRRSPKMLLLADGLDEDGDFLREKARERGIVPTMYDTSPYKAVAILS